MKPFDRRGSAASTPLVPTSSGVGSGTSTGPGSGTSTGPGSGTSTGDGSGMRSGAGSVSAASTASADGQNARHSSSVMTPSDAMSSSSGTSSPRRSAAIALSTVRTVSMNSKTTVRKSFSASPSSDTATLVIAAGMRSAGRPDWFTRSITFCANANAGWPVGTSSIDDLRDFPAFPGPCALPIAPVGHPAISARRRAPRERGWRACAAASRRRRRW